MKQATTVQQQHEEQHQYQQQHQVSKDNSNHHRNTRSNDGLMTTTIQTRQQQPIVATTPTKPTLTPKISPTFVFGARRSIGSGRVNKDGFNSSATTTTSSGGGTTRIKLDDILDELMNMEEDEYVHHDLITTLHKTVGAPKAALKNDYYGRRKLIPTYLDPIYKTFYHSWCDQNPQSHLLTWTSIFVCPVTGELFPSGRWPYQHERPPTQSCYNYYDTSNTSNTTTTTSYWWFPRKNFAEDGAAARCFDCKVHREREIVVQRESQRPKPRSVGRVVQIGLEPPYLEQDGRLAIPTTDYSIVPSDIRLKIQQQQIEIVARIRQEKMIPSSSIVPNSNLKNNINNDNSKQPKQNNDDDDTSATQELKVYDGSDDDD